MGNEHIKAALNPLRFPGMSLKFRAIIGYMLEAKWTTPSIEQLIVTSDGILMARVSGDSGFNDDMGDIVSFKKNWDTLVHYPRAGLTGDEISYLEMLPNVTIRNYGE
jgi:hypothetical protein